MSARLPSGCIIIAIIVGGRVSHLAVGLFSWLPALAGQEASIRVQTRLVQVPVSVTTPDGRNIEGLKSRDFRVLDDGLEREIAADVFDSGAARISLVVAIQTSAVPASTLAGIRRIGTMIQPLVVGRRGEAAIVTFDRHIRWLQDFTRDPRDLQLSLRDLKNGSPIESRLLDAVVQIADLMRDREGRKVLLVISDGHDHGSDTPLADAIESVQREGIEVFGARSVPDPPGTKSKSPDVVRALTAPTGGRDYPFRRERGVEKAVENLGVELHSQYILSFHRSADSDGMHQIDVSVPARAGLQIRFRQAYGTQ